MKIRTDRILKIMHIFAWIVFIGFLIKIGAILISYFISLRNENAAKDLYEGMNYFDYKQSSIINYTILVCYRVLQFCTQAYIAFIVVRLLSALNIQRPFNVNVLKKMQTISYSLVFLWAIIVIHNIHVGVLEASTGIKATLLSSEFVYIIGIVYIFSLLFKRGIELQLENDLTI